MPEVFAPPPPTVVAGFMAQEAETALLEWNPLISMAMRRRGLFVTDLPETAQTREPRLPRNRHSVQLWGLLRRNFFDRFGRR
jgi:hypothetical protein